VKNVEAGIDEEVVERFDLNKDHFDFRSKFLEERRDFEETLDVPSDRTDIGLEFFILPG
jgi:hypothetical protein